MTPGTTYVVSYLAPQGHYSVTLSASSLGLDAGPLTAPAAQQRPLPLRRGGGFPTYTWQHDELLRRRRLRAGAATVTVDRPDAGAGATGVSIGDHVRRRLVSADRRPATLDAGQARAPRRRRATAPRRRDAQTLTFTPSAALPADADVTMTVSGVVSTTARSLADPDVDVPHGGGRAVGTVSLFPDARLRRTAAERHGGRRARGGVHPVGQRPVTAIRFYKGPGNTGTHTGSLWAARGHPAGHRHRSTAETASGLADGAARTPVALTAGQTYVASYHAPRAATR